MIKSTQKTNRKDFQDARMRKDKPACGFVELVGLIEFILWGV